MLTYLKHAHTLFRRAILCSNNIRLFAKEVKQKGGKKDDPKGGAVAAAAPVTQEVPIEQVLTKWIQPNHPSLSPSQLKMMQEGFNDISTEDKQILDKFAEKLIDLPSAVFYDVLKRGALGTTDLYYTAVEELPSTEIAETIKHLRKQI